VDVSELTGDALKDLLVVLLSQYGGEVERKHLGRMVKDRYPETPFPVITARVSTAISDYPELFERVPAKVRLK
jgi:hypothetical protein